MNQQYDTIIVGSGLGGLSAAATSSKRGLKVLLLERHTKPGGYATTFTRDRFEFEVSLHALSGIGTKDAPGPLFQELDALGVAERVSFIPLKHLYRSVGPTWDLVLPDGAEAYQAALIDRFPQEARGIERMVRQVLTVGYEVDLLRHGGHSTRPLPTLARFPNLVHAACVPLATVLHREITHPLARLAIAQIWSYFALPPSRLSFLMFAAGLNMHLLYGSATLRGKSQSLSDAFVDVIRSEGGEAIFSRGVKRILIQNGKTAGVETEDGECFFADTVISNADPLSTLNLVSEPSAVPDALSQRFRRTPPSLSSINLYLGLSKPSSALGIRDFEVCINDTSDLDLQYRDCLRFTAPRNVTLCALDVHNPDAAPEGAGMVTLTALSEGCLWERMSPDAYLDAKDRMTEWMLAIAGRYYPKLAGAVETIVSATPITNMRYTGNPGGAIYGFANTPLENPGFRVENRSPIPGLYFAGAWTRPGGGYQAVIASGAGASKAVLEDKSDRGLVLRAAPLKTGRALQKKPRGARGRKLRGVGLIVKDRKQVQATLRANHPADIPEDGTGRQRPSVQDLVRRFRADAPSFVLHERRFETPDTVTLRFKPEKSPLPPFVPGQYFSVRVLRDGVWTNRAYSASSPPTERDHIDFTVKHREDGNVSRHLALNLSIGDTVQLVGPFGEFCYHPHRDKEEMVGIAAGSGITPFMSMVQATSAARRPKRLTLFLGARRPSDLIFHRRLRELEAVHDWLTVIPTVSAPTPEWFGETGRIDAARLLRHFDRESLRHKSFFLCAPRALCMSLVPRLTALGVPRSQIRVESFGAPVDVTKEEHWPRQLKSGAAFEVRYPGVPHAISAAADTPLLDSLEQAGVRLEAHCRAGICDGCKVVLVSGKVFVSENPLRPAPPVVSNRIRTCMSYPVSDLTLMT